MTVLQFRGFKGVVPKLSARELPDMNAQVATNIKTSSGELRQYRKSSLVITPNKTMPPLTMYRAVWLALSAWMSWPTVVDVVRFPMAAEAEPRFGWTGDNEPRWAPYSLAISGGGNNYPAACYALGVPVPVAAPSIVPTGGTGSTVTRSYCYTFFSQNGEESGPSPVSASTSGKVDASWAVSGMSAFPISSCAGSAAFAAGVTTFTDSASAPHWLRVGDEVVLNATKAVVASIPTAYSFTVSGNFASATSWSRVAPWNTTGMKRRLYRTAGTAAGFQLVADNVGTSYTDTLLDAAILGDDLISQGWKPPPPGMSGLIVTPFGSVAGFLGNTLYLSEPNQPHAFKDAYTYAADYDIVAIAVSGADIAVATTANVYIGVGSDPSTFGISKIDAPYPCLSKRSMMSDGVGAMYASRVGLIYVSGGTAKVVTENLFTVDEWLPLNPASMFSRGTNGRVYIGYVDSYSNQKILVLDSVDGNLFNLDISCSSFYVDETTGLLYLGTNSGIEEFDPQGGVPMPLEWMSKRITLPTPVNFSVAKVDFDFAVDPLDQAAQQAAHDAAALVNAGLYAAGDLGGQFDSYGFNEIAFNSDILVDVPEVPASNLVAFSLYSKNQLVFSRSITGSSAFRLPAGFKTDDVSIKINGQCPVSRVLLADSMEALKQA